MLTLASTERADALERQYGWMITSVPENGVTMSYRRQIEIMFDMASFLPNRGASRPLKAENSPFDIRYIAERYEYEPSPFTVEKQFFVQRTKMHLQGLQQGSIHVKDLLASVGSSWDKAHAVVEEIRLVNIQGFTETVITAERCLTVTCTLILPDVQTKIKAVFDVTTSSEEASLSVKVQPTATVVYGERFNESRMTEYLKARIEGVVSVESKGPKGSWGRAVGALMEKLRAQGKA